MGQQKDVYNNIYEIDSLAMNELENPFATKVVLGVLKMKKKVENEKTHSKVTCNKILECMTLE